MTPEELARCKAQHPAFWRARRRELDGDDTVTEPVYREEPRESA